MQDAGPYILLVDDEPAHAEAVRRAFDAAGRNGSIQVAGTLRKYRELVGVRPPEIAIVDLNLPDGRALEVLSSPPEAGAFPVVVMTSHGNQQVAVEAMKAGALDYVVKSPEAFAGMPRTLERALRERGLLQERRRAEEALRASEEKFRGMAEQLADVLFVTDSEGGITYLSPSASRVFGWTPGEMAGRHFTDFVPEEEIPNIISSFQAAVVSGQPAQNLALTMKRKDGSAFSGELNGSRVERDGAVAGVMGLIRDVTERKRAETALRESEQRYRSLFENMLEGFAYCKTLYDDRDRPVDFVCLEVNDVFQRLTGLREVVGKRVSEVIPGIRELSPELFESYGRVALTGQPEKLEFDFKSLAQWPAISVYSPEKGYFVAVFDNITERKLAEAKLAQSQKMESIGRLAGGVAHDFNNLLTVINGYSLLLLGKLSPADPLRAGLDEIHKAGERAAGLTLQLLAFSRKQVLEPQVLDLNRVVGEMRPMLGRLVGEDVEVRVELSAQAGPVHADPHQLEQVIMNLVVNARDAMPHGGKLLIETAGVELDPSYVQSHPEARAGRYVLLAVSDTGVGMDEQTRRRIFEPFFTTKGVGKGTGLGLSMVEGIVAQSGGHIQVYSEPGHGTTFKIYLPRVEEAAAVSQPEAALPLGGKETVLVVEDQAEVREYAVTVLKAYGYRVIQAQSAGEALLIFEREPERIDLVLTDVVMPNISGRELANRLEKLQPGIKVLFMSGYTDNVIVHYGVLDEGAQFIQKPFSPEQLAVKVREVLGPPKPLGRILVAGDEAGVRSFLRTALEEGGYEVIEAADGNQALRQARAGGVDLVITDIVMPEQEGIETIQALRKEIPGIGIIAISGRFISGRFEVPYLKMAEMLGADAVLAKPVSTELLLARVAGVLASRR